MVDEAEAVATLLSHPERVGNNAAGGVGDYAEGVGGADAGIIRQCDGNSAQVEGLLDPLEDGVIEVGLLLGGRLTPEEAGNLRTVVPRLSVAGRDHARVKIRAGTE